MRPVLPLLCLASFLEAAQAILSARRVVQPRVCQAAARTTQPQASAADSAIAELAARLGRQLTAAETDLAREAVGRAINELETRFLRSLAVGGEAQPEQRELKGGAAAAAASWGSWRVRAPTDAKARAHHVLVNSESQALSLLKELTFGADIGELAAEHSACPSKDRGGDLGEFEPGDMATEFDAFVFDASSPVGVPLGPVRTPFGYHVVIIDERTM